MRNLKVLALTAVLIGCFSLAAPAAESESVASPAPSTTVEGDESSKGPEVNMRVPKGFMAAKDSAPEPYTNTGWAKEIIHEKTDIEMVFIPAGEFMMGAPSSEKGRSRDEGPQHRVVLTKPFYLGKYEVTNVQYQAFLDATGYDGSRDADSNYLRHHRDWNNHASIAADYPIVCVSWNNCVKFCQWAGLRLPTEAEWEYACRAGTTTRFSFGDDQSQLGGYAWYKGNSGEKTHPVGQKRPNGWSLYDMHGNVWEWCANWYASGYYAKRAGSDPQGPYSGQHRLLRGGSWHRVPRLCRSALRGRYMPDGADGGNGFRVAMTLE